MTAQDWNLEDIKTEEIVEHLEKFHKVPWNDRRALTQEEFIQEHFPETIKIIEERENGYMNEASKKVFRKAISKIKSAIKMCEEKGIAVTNVIDEIPDEHKGEWRICEPTESQIEYLKVFR